MSLHDDPEIAALMRETDEQIEQMRASRALRPEWENERERCRAELREFEERVRRFADGTGGAAA